MGQDHLNCDGGVGEVGVLYLEAEDIGEGIIEFELPLLYKLHNGDCTETFGAGGDSEHRFGINGLIFFVLDSPVEFVDLLIIFSDLNLDSFEVSGLNKLIDLGSEIGGGVIESRGYQNG